MLHETDPEFLVELTQSRNAAPSLSPEEAVMEDQENPELEVDVDDDSVIPIEAVVDSVHGVLPTGPEQQFQPTGEGLTSTAEAEETLVEEIDGVLTDTTGTAAGQQGRGLHKKFRNTLYTDKALKSI